MLNTTKRARLRKEGWAVKRDFLIHETHGKHSLESAWEIHQKLNRQAGKKKRWQELKRELAETAILARQMAAEKKPYRTIAQRPVVPDGFGMDSGYGYRGVLRVQR
jgi:hypothetical protein